MTSSAKRVLPNDSDLEAAILGGIFLRQENLALVPELEPGDFYDFKHRAVFEAMRNLEARSTPIDPATVEFELARLDKLDAVGGVAFLGELTLRVPTSDNVRAYAAIVMRLHQARRMAIAAAEVMEAVYTMGWDDAEEYLAFSERAVLEVSHGRKVDRPKHVGELVIQRVREYDDILARRNNGDAALTGVPSGISVLDNLLGGYPRKVVTVVAGRPGQGKTSLLMAAADAASAAGIGVMVFSLEDGREAFADSIIARTSGVPTDRLRSAELQRGDMEPLARAVGTLRKRENWRFDEHVRDAAGICRELRRAKTEIQNFGLGIVDYLQIVRRNPRLNEDQAIREHMAYFQPIAKELGIALVVASQLNRDLEKRDDKRPGMPDLRGSGAIEEMAKLVLFVYRGSTYYDQPKKGIDYDCSCAPNAPCYCAPDDFSRQLQIIVGKNNQGQSGRVFATWRGAQKHVS